MKKVHIFINKLDGSNLGGTAIIFDEENKLEATMVIDYSDKMTNEEILKILEVSNGEIFEQLIGKRPPRRR